jgi:hypothetical protein
MLLALVGIDSIPTNSSANSAIMNTLCPSLLVLLLSEAGRGVAYISYKGSGVGPISTTAK